MTDRDPTASAGNDSFEDLAEIQKLIDRINKESITTSVILDAFGMQNDEHTIKIQRMRQAAMAMLILRKLHNPDTEISAMDVLKEIISYDVDADIYRPEELEHLVRQINTRGMEDPLSGISFIYERIVDFAESRSISPTIVLEDDDMYFEFIASGQSPNQYADEKVRELGVAQTTLLNIIAISLTKGGMIDDELTEAQKVSMVMYLMETENDLNDFIGSAQNLMNKVARSKLAYGIIMGWGMHEIEMLDDDIRKSMGLLPGGQSSDIMEYPESRYQAIKDYCDIEGWKMSELTKDQQIQLFRRMGIIF